MATMGLEEIAAQANHPCLLFQLYVIKDRDLVSQWVRQAEAAGYKALVVTVDAQRLGTREADERNRYTRTQPGHTPAGTPTAAASLLYSCSLYKGSGFYACSVYGHMIPRF